MSVSQNTGGFAGQAWRAPDQSPRFPTREARRFLPSGGLPRRLATGPPVIGNGKKSGAIWPCREVSVHGRRRSALSAR